MDAVVPTGVRGGAGKHMVLFTILPLPRLLAVIVPALGAFDPACEAGPEERRKKQAKAIRDSFTGERRQKMSESMKRLRKGPLSFSSRTVVRLSTVFLAKRLTDLVMMRSIFPG